MKQQFKWGHCKSRKEIAVLMRGVLIASFIILFCLFPQNIIQAEEIPAPASDFYVLDQAAVMSDATRSVILNTSNELARLTKAQVAVVTLKTLNGRPLEEVSLGILRKWQLGDKKLNNGALILLVPGEHKSRIEVGYGLEGVLTDSKTGYIQDTYMLPYYKTGNYDQGLLNGYRAVVNEVAKEYNVTLSVDSTPKAPIAQSRPKSNPLITILSIFFIMVLIWVDRRYLNGFILGFLLGMLFRGGGRGGFGGGGFGGGGSIGGGGSGGGGGSSRGW